MSAKRLIQGGSSEQRYLHSDEIFRKERNWNIYLPPEREFKNGYCIVTDKDDTTYSIDELIELLNQFQKENKGFESCSHNWSMLYDEAKNKVEELSKENKILKSLLNEMKDRNGEIWLDDGRIFRLRKIFKGEWRND